MNVLLLTQNTQAAGLISRELTSRIPGIRLVTAWNSRHALRQLPEIEKCAAVVLEVEREGEDSVGVIRAVRSANNHATIICIIEDDAPNTGYRLLSCGADDFVRKGEGFVDDLTGALQRACRPLFPWTSSWNSPKHLYSIRGNRQDGTVERDTAEAGIVPVPHDRHLEEVISAGDWQQLQEAMRAAQAALDEHSSRFENERQMLQSEWERFRNQMQAAGLKEKSEEEALRTRQERQTEMEERHIEELHHRTRAESDLEQQLYEGEKERIRLLESMRRLEAELISRTAELAREREQWNLWRQRFKEKLLAIENRHTELERAVFEEKQKSNSIAEQHARERADWEMTKHQLELRIAYLEQELRLVGETTES